MSRIYDFVKLLAFHPLLWGSLAAVAFYAVLDAGYVSNPVVLRYLTGHWTAMVCVTLFFVGLAALTLKVLHLIGEFEVLRAALLDPVGLGGQPVSYAPTLLKRLEKQPATWQQTSLMRRLREAIEYVSRKGTAETLDEHLRYLSDTDALRKHASYGLVRIVIWAVPFIGCLGTVIGIGGAVANLAPEAFDNSLAGIISGLGMVFDTTALALALSVALMALQFILDQVESRLLMTVDARATGELIGRFKATVDPNDAQFGAMRTLADTMIEATENLVKRQSELWEMGVETAHRRFSDQSSNSSQQLEAAVATAMAKVLGGRGTTAAVEVGHVEATHAPYAPISEEELANQREVMRELAEITKQGSKNWPCRKSPHFKRGKLLSAVFGADWLES